MAHNNNKEQGEASNQLVKSKVVMKYPIYEAPATFNRLDTNTNLNLPPSNWLMNSQNGPINGYQSLYQEACFGSFRLGLTFPDWVGQVDVVSDAENIKKLLKLPYAPNGPVSMICHKVGNTLLIDEFDIQKYLLRKGVDDWQWLRKFILEHIVACKLVGHDYCIKDKSREALQSKNLLSKFLHYSCQTSSDSGDIESMNTTHDRQISLPIIGPVLPEPKVEQNVPDPKSSRDYSRNVVWTLENIRMLLGVDLPIFGGHDRPAITLRLRDMSKPINVLTGIDYWLDNLMCNVPEVAMCYHVDGIVQKYEIIKTEDLPNLENSKFSPKMVNNVAHNILSFLRTNATKEGHTYWLFKGRNDDVVKLYDLTTLYRNEEHINDEGADTEPNNANENPFTVPVGMLMYSVARNMKKTSEKMSRKTAANMRTLLDGCLKLLPKEKYPQIVTSSHYMLSDLYIPEGIDTEHPNFDEIGSDMHSIFDDDYDEVDGETETEGDIDTDAEMGNDEAVKYQSTGETGSKANISLQEICSFKPFRKSVKSAAPIPLTTDTDERCRICLEHICNGLSGLKFFNAKHEASFIKESETRAKEEEYQRVLYEEQNPNMAKSDKPIPLSYANLLACKSDQAKDEQNTNQKGISVGQNNKQLSTVFNSKRFGSWDLHLKLLLIEKACLVYTMLADHYLNNKRYGACLRANYIASRCHLFFHNKNLSELIHKERSLLLKAGDCFYHIASNIDKYDEYVREFNEEDQYERDIIKELSSELPECGKPNWIQPEHNIEALILKSVEFYKLARDASSGTDLTDLKRRLGNCYNELGKLYMELVKKRYKRFGSTGDFEFALASKSFLELSKAIAEFEDIKDNTNYALVALNIANLFRMRAQIATMEEFPKFFKDCYNDAFQWYNKALARLNNREENPELWDIVQWECSTMAYKYAIEVQDHSSVNKSSYNETAKEVVELLQNALKLCKVNTTSNQKAYRFRTATIHRRLASFHHHQFLRIKSKIAMRLATNNYKDAIRIFGEIDGVTTELFETTLEFIRLQECLADSSAHESQKISYYETILQLCLQLHGIIKAIPNSSELDATEIPVKSLLETYESRLQNALQTLTRFHLKSKDEKKILLYKNLYEKTLRSKLKITQNIESTAETSSRLYELVGQLKEIWQPPT